ncbi:hypothetical protein ACFFQF_10885 [Haladaptatus pallidirubidus]|uniref:Uncharacterized protein n=1 Tax=Haladaptatus pallidirubidus TaxID=1008152 RepID=A0AAV3UFA0_9EURY|nr:hypothetical protein [Haladaptatus pallidirubidus]
MTDDARRNRRRFVVVAFALTTVVSIGFSVLLGDSLRSSLVRGIGIGLGFAAGYCLFWNGDSFTKNND